MGRHSEKEEEQEDNPEQTSAIPIISRPKEISKTVYEELSTSLTNIMDISSKTVLLLTSKVEGMGYNLLH